MTSKKTFSDGLPDTDPQKLLSVAAELFRSAAQADSLAAFWTGTLPMLAATLGAEYLACISSTEGQWTVAAEWGLSKPLPIELLADAFDRESPRGQSGWLVVPLWPRKADGHALIVRMDPSAPIDAAMDWLVDLAPTVRQAAEAAMQHDRERRRLIRAEAMLEIAGRWNQTREIEPLLTEMAEAATHLLSADRASIFLWDRPNRALVGRPALGLSDGELRIPDDSGVVGEVIRSGRPRRVDAAREPQQIDRRVDAQLHYQTRTVLCVPLRGRSGELFGAFEALNKQAGQSFSQEDEETLGELAAHASVALENAQDRQRLLSVNRQIADEAAGRVQMIGQSPAIEALRSIVRRVADTDLAVLISGENGTGKEVVAQSIHYLSRRRDQPFVAINCAAIPETLAESELFGHEKGAFTDARQSRPGKFELAAGGTIFLDEIGDLSLGSQAKLLRVLEEKTLVRVGGSVPIHTDARLLAATNQNLAEMVRTRKFREDLYFRLNVVTMELPPLRDRGDDVLLLADHFLDDFCRRARRKTPTFSAAAQKRLLEHPWPGNVRELRNLMERLAYLSTSDRIEAEELAFILSPGGRAPTAVELGESLAAATDRFQTDYIRRQIEQSGGNMSAAAERLGLQRSNLYRKMRQLGM
ncbi:MAG: sigma-54-dependent Fis family transcriptional regulator [Thermoguttaceae bacterium]